MARCILKMNEKPTAPLAAILQMMPNLKHLEILGSVEQDWIQFDPQIPSSLLSIQLQPGSTSVEIVTLDKLQVWISGNRFLQFFESGHILELDSEEKFFKFLQTVSHLDSIQLKVRFVRSNTVEVGGTVGASPHSGTPRLKLTLAPNQVDNTLVSLWLKCLAPHTTKLKLSISDSGLEINGPRESLDTLHLTVSQSTVVGRFLPVHFPSLRRVYICYTALEPPPNGVFFRGNVFPIVETLHLDGAFKIGGDGFESWGGLFPNVRNFRLEGIINNLHLQTTARMFPKLRHLNLSSLEQSNFSFSPFILERVANSVAQFSPQHTWHLESVKGNK